MFALSSSQLAPRPAAPGSRLLLRQAPIFVERGCVVLCVALSLPPPFQVHAVCCNTAHTPADRPARSLAPLADPSCLCVRLSVFLMAREGGLRQCHQSCNMTNKPQTCRGSNFTTSSRPVKSCLTALLEVRRPAAPAPKVPTYTKFNEGACVTHASALREEHAAAAAQLLLLLTTARAAQMRETQQIGVDPV